MISDIRTTIFDLQTDPPRRATGCGPACSSWPPTLASGSASSRGFPSTGPVDTVVDSEVGEQLLAVLRESLSNVIRHASSLVGVDRALRRGRARPARVRRRGRPRTGAAQSGFGLHNMAARAASLGGASRSRPGPGGGTVVEWRVPLAAAADRVLSNGTGGTAIATALRRSPTFGGASCRGAGVSVWRHRGAQRGGDPLVHRRWSRRRGTKGDTDDGQSERRREQGHATHGAT